MKTFVKVLIVLVCFVMSVSMFGGCTSSSDPADSTDQETEVKQPEEEKKEIITLTPESQQIEDTLSAVVTITDSEKNTFDPEDVTVVEKETQEEASNVSIAVNGNKITVSSDEPGSFYVQVHKNGVDSNQVLVEFTQSEESGNVESENSEVLTVDQAIEQQDSLAGSGQTVTVKGNLPQALVQLKNGKAGPVIWNSDTTQYIVLAGNPVSFGGTEAEVTGTLDLVDGMLTMNVESAQAAQ